jgi:scyllo-inositol 2-dehydrogenase (NADP+)
MTSPGESIIIGRTNKKDEVSDMKIATIGTGFIVERFLSAVDDVDGAECTAMYSRAESSARPMADKFGGPTIYTDLNRMLDEADADFIYVASPNSLHFEHVRTALHKGKHVICEKPFTSTARELEKLRALAKEKRLMLFEAITTIHLPNYELIRQNIGKIGPIRFIQANYSQYSSRYDKFLAGETPNIFNPAFSGGALVDINVYNIHFIMNLFGKPDAVHYMANTHANGIDTSGVVVMKYPGFIGEAVGAKDTESPNFCLIQGEKGYIEVENGSSCEAVTVKTADEEVVLNEQTNPNKLYYELKTFRDIYENEDYDRCYELLDYSCTVLDIVEQARKSAGIVFAAD